MENQNETKNAIVVGIKCNKCGNELPPHSAERHLDIDDNIHKCPHKMENQNEIEQKMLEEYSIQRYECFCKHKDWLMEAKKRKGKGAVKRRTFVTFLIIGASEQFDSVDKDYDYCNKFGRGYWSYDVIKSFTKEEQEIIINDIAVKYGAFDY